MSAASQWAADLAGWAIPDEIIASAPESPWIHPVQQFVVDGEVSDSLSHARAREALPVGGSVLDVGCGGGRGALALVPPAAHVIGVDHQPSMVAAFADAAEQRGVRHDEVLGDWPDVVDATPTADVVVCHHVAYNVADLVPFVRALSARARRRVVLELPVQHPLADLSPLWKQFWDLDRPESPRATDAWAVCREAGIDAHLEEWIGEHRRPAAMSHADVVRATRVRLCLTPDRDDEIATALAALEPPTTRALATLWWNVA